MDRLAGIVLREGLNFRPMPFTALFGQKRQRPVSGRGKFPMTLKKTDFILLKNGEIVENMRTVNRPFSTDFPAIPIKKIR